MKRCDIKYGDFPIYFMDVKECACCGEVKPEFMFHWSRDNYKKKSRACYCKECARKASLAWYEQEDNKKKKSLWQKRNPDKVRYSQKRYHKKNKDNPKYVLNARMSNGIRLALGGAKNGSWQDMVPYTANELVKHLGQTMPNGYTWADIHELHIDHIIPISKFNFDKPEDDDFHRCWSLENLQLLPAVENIKKSNKLEKPFQPRLVFGK